MRAFALFRGFWLNTPTLIRSECKKVGHNILFIMTILLYNIFKIIASLFMKKIKKLDYMSCDL